MSQGVGSFLGQNNALVEMGQFSAGGKDYLYSVANNQLGYDIWQMLSDGRIAKASQVTLPFPARRRMRRSTSWWCWRSGASNS
ncbi:hypothetical protein QWZ10_18240 [Paracoccus cavernae]|uniref:Uncharacterized protein n=1 Tax=Paracoccus cavernae TaxID=1571207 RepID=A0ABT8DAA5_9RHOB|nr:hypothetical protein [Paracoccus cavernae]